MILVQQPIGPQYLHHVEQFPYLSMNVTIGAWPPAAEEGNQVLECMSPTGRTSRRRTWEFMGQETSRNYVKRVFEGHSSDIPSASNDPSTAAGHSADVEMPAEEVPQEAVHCTDVEMTVTEFPEEAGRSADDEIPQEESNILSLQN